MHITTPSGLIIETDFREQISTLGKPFRLSGVARSGKYNWQYSFRYIGTDTFFTVEVDFNNNFVKFVKN